ncbi:MAG: metal ABC transporter substrate-binding protein, partial [Clostridia bacterium]|nr:metal ABC transporter substrate-binding protein [Clostridia bacterium]
EGAGLSATLDDVTENSRNFKLVTQDDETLAANLSNYEADIAVMSSKLSVATGVSLNKSAVAIEEIDSEAAL